MAGKNFWKSDWFLGLAVAIAVFLLSATDLVRSLERKAYDLGVRASTREPSEDIAVIAIDDASIANIGRWPWPRDVHARLIESLRTAQAKVIGYTVFFSEPQVDPGLPYIARLRELFGSLSPQGQEQLAEIGEVLGEAEAALNTDRKLAESVGTAGNVVLPILFRLGEPLGRPDRDLPDYVRRNALPLGTDGPLPVPAASLDIPVLDEVGRNAAALGHLNSPPDVDGAIRTEPLVLAYFDQFYPSLSLQIAARFRNLGPADVHARLGESLSLGRLNIRTDPSLQMYTYFYKDQESRPAFALDSFFDVYSGKIPAEKYRGKIVLIGTTAVGVGSVFLTPVSPAMPAVLMQAHAVSSILQEHFFVAPIWGGWVSFAVFLLVALYLILLLPRLKAGTGAAATAVVLVALLAVHFSLMITQLMWIQLMSAVVLLVIGHLTLTTKRFLVTERGKARSDFESAESNRMLGLAFQGQGQLDMAFDKFKKCPLDDQLMDNLYNLALDFERKRQFNKAQSAFEYMATHNRKYKDLENRIARAKAMSETVILGSGGARTNASTLILDGGSVEKPMLGRYQVEKELGKGAMGVVYLGRDPKIGRVVAIKTMALSQEFEVDELEEVKTRFFREAETAGRLNHPHIVTIFDAGEEHDLAYIAMEFLKGQDLTGHVRPGTLLPLPVAMSIVARVADALEYAHRQNVVHRDIKPANIMYDPESDSVKVTDFGIARITDSSKTKTGMVLGTPSYMSPEQLAGKKIDGQSDLFSLGVTLYQLACGSLPFQGESMAQLMYKIANEQPIDPTSLNSALPECLVAIIHRALAKDETQRYKNGEEMARAIRECAEVHSAVDVSL
jgi:eukaryotic-like serine/threonine-protein kinase